MNVTQLEKFYFRTDLGRFASEILNNQVRAIWPDPVGGSLVGYGFSAPLLSHFIAQNERVVNLIPNQLGISKWPPEKPNINVPTLESNWPIPSSGVERVIILHGLETSENHSNPLAECWRSLAPEGQMILIVPNRMGLWARSKASPFCCNGQNSAFTLAKIQRLLHHHKFQIDAYHPALFSPPKSTGTPGKFSRFFENACCNTSLNFGGVTIVVARKRIFLKQSPGIGATVKTGLEILQGAPTPAPKPATGRLKHFDPSES